MPSDSYLKEYVKAFGEDRLFKVSLQSRIQQAALDTDHPMHSSAKRYVDAKAELDAMATVSINAKFSAKYPREAEATVVDEFPKLREFFVGKCELVCGTIYQLHVIQKYGKMIFVLIDEAGQTTDMKVALILGKSKCAMISGCVS